MPRPTRSDATWDEHYGDERDAAFLYRALAGIERDRRAPRTSSRSSRGVEDRHAQRWEELFREAGAAAAGVHDRVADARARVDRAPLRHCTVLPLMLAEEGREVQAYLGLARQSTNALTHTGGRRHRGGLRRPRAGAVGGHGPRGRALARRRRGGYLRSVVYGFNDGLTANFGLVAGVIGADVAPHIVLISGVAGAIADALSMGSSGFLAAKSEAEVHAHQIEMERHEMRLMPDLEEEELAVIYEAKGLTPERARETAKAMMQDPQQALDADGA